MVFIDRKILTGFCREVFLAIGLSETEATDSAEILVDADARGIASHGVSRLKRYVNGVKKGVMISGVQPSHLSGPGCKRRNGSEPLTHHRQLPIT